MVHLSVNVDHVATLRQARQAVYPDPAEAARLAEEAGASGITVHLRSDRRHIQDADLAALRSAVQGKLNLEMAATEEMTAIALARRPDQVTLVPERPEEVTTEGGLDLAALGAAVGEAAERLAAAEIALSFFLDPDRAQVEALARLRERRQIDTVLGLEINTDRYCKAHGSDVKTELRKLQRIAALGLEHGLRVYAGHGLTTGNVGPVAAIPMMEELNIGHAIVARAVLVGIEAAVREMLEAMRSAED